MKHNRFSVFKRFLPYIKIPYTTVAAIQGLSLITVVLSMLSPYLYSKFIDDVMEKKITSLLFPIIASMICLFVLQIITSGVSAYLSFQYTNKVSLSLKRLLFNNLINRNISDLIKIDITKEKTIIDQDSTIVSGFFSSEICEYLLSYIYAAVYLLLMILISPMLSLICVIVIPITIILGKSIGKRFNMLQKQLWDISSHNNNYVFNSLQRWKEIKAHNYEEYFSKKYQEELKPEKHTLVKWMFLYACNDSYYRIKNGLFNNVLMYFLGGLLILNGQITVGSLVMFISYMGNFCGKIDDIIKSMTSFLSNNEVYNRLFATLEYEKTEKAKLDNSDLTFSAESISFSYGNNLPNIFSEASIQLPFGKTYLVFGKSGEGKSTFVKLLLQLIEPKSGVIRLGEKAINEINQNEYFKVVSGVIQDNHFFNLSIRDNLLLASPNATQQQLDFACESANILDFINSLPCGYDTIIGEQGIKLSGGQRQRLAIARLVLHRPLVAIFDESTSSLDAISEAKVLSALKEIFKDQTIIIVSHKTAMNMEYDNSVTVHNEKLVLGRF